MHIATLYFLINLQHNDIIIRPTAIGGHNDNIDTTGIAAGDDRFIAPLYHVSISGAGSRGVVGAAVGF